MRKIAALILLWALICLPTFAANAQTIFKLCYVNANGGCTTVATANPLPVSITGSSATVAANITQLGSNTINLGAGAVSTGTLRITQASDSPEITALTTLITNTSSSVPAGTSTVGGFVPRFGSTSTDGTALVASAISTLESNKVFKAGPGNLTKFAVTTGATSGYVALSNTIAAPTAGGAALTYVGCYTAPANSTIGDTFPFPVWFSVGITVVFTTGSQCQTNTASATASFQAQFN